MRRTVFFLSAALLLGLAAGQHGFTQPTGAQSPASAITACARPGGARMGPAVQGGGCEASSLDSTPGSVVSHTVLAGGCADADLHVVRYIPAGGPPDTPLTATWCS
ncbi:MAG: hypothetical protein Q7T33_01365 [Dehalococcoidia bacterium]|nr:hypothetical protein [Dehalococcoidia bacterium]